MGKRIDRPAEPVETEEQKRQREIIEGIANNIAALGKAVQALINGPLNRKALMILLASSSKVSQEKVSDVLKALETLEADWLNWKKK